jgi:hypothetical protein
LEREEERSVTVTEIISDWIVTGIELLLTVGMIVGIILIMATSQQLNAAVSEQQALSEELKIYREHNQYDNTHVYPQDIISAIYQSRGIPAVYVKSGKGEHRWTASYAPCEYSTAAITACIDQTVVYDASLVYSASGEVLAYEFVKHKSGCGR